MRTGQAFFQRVASSLIIPITLLPLAAILLAIGDQLGIGPLEAAGLALIQSWLPLFYGIGVSVGFTGGDGMGALSVAACYLVMVTVAEAVSGDPALNVGVLGGIIAGAVSVWIYNRVKDVELPEFLGLFSGKRMGPIATAPAGLALGYLFGAFWPPIYEGITLLGQWVAGAGGYGAFIYGSALRLLVPTGLHHILMQLVDYQIGTWSDPATGRVVVGEYLRFLSGDPDAGRILSGFFVTLGFSPLGAALAMVREARPEQRRKVAGLMTTGVLTAMILGVTEPVEFAFVFASPVLFGIHVLLSGLASLLAWALDIHLGGYALPMILLNWHRQQNGLLLLPLGVAYIALYYYTFRAVIRWLRPPILGQVPEEEAVESEQRAAPEAAPSGPGEEEVAAFVEALGGPGNIAGLEACMTRLRLHLHDPAAVDDRRLRMLGAAAVLRQGAGTVQVVVGTRAAVLANRLRAALEQHAPAGARDAPGVILPPLAHAMETDQEPAGVVTICSPFTGRVIPLEQVPDPTFAGRLVGDGVAVEPAEGTVVAPAAGTVASVFPGGHAFGIRTPEGLEILVHIGIDTVGLQGEGFHIRLREGDAVAPGADAGRFEPERIAAQGKSLASPVLITNPDRVERLQVVAGEQVRAGDPLLTVVLK